MDEKYLICYFQTCDIVGDLELITVHAETKEIMPDYCQKISSQHIIKYFEDIPNADEIVAKAVIFNVYDFENELLFDSNSAFFRFIFRTFKKNGIPFRFISNGNFNLTMLLINAKIDPRMDDHILIILVSDKGVRVQEISRTSNGYQHPPLKDFQEIKCQDGYDPKKMKAEIFDSRQNPNKIIVAATSRYSKKIWKAIMEVLGNEKVIYIENLSHTDQGAAIAEIASHLLDETKNQYYIIPRFSFTVINTAEKFSIRIFCDLTMGLPFKKIHFAQRRPGQYYIQRYFKDEKESEIVEIYPFLEGRFHKVKLTFTVDEKMTPKLTQEPYIDPLIEKLPLKLTEKMSSSKIPIIGFFDNSSIICLWNQKENGYKFCQNWNGLYGEDLFISFDEEKPKYRKQAMEIFAQKQTFIVYDLLSIMSAKPDNIYVNPEWPFTITKDEKNPILLEFDNFDETRKLATPEFLMALLLKDHLKVIKEEIGTKSTEIGVVFFDKIENTKFWDAALLEEKFKASCSLIKLDCKIINVDEL